MQIPVYPRWRGEHIFRHITKRWGIGLSPLARGTLQNKTVLIAFCRFIPAGAGNTKWQFWPLLIMAVYPRWRGEHYQEIVEVFMTSGLSPLARGTRAVRRQHHDSDRFIPAGAGNTGELARRYANPPVYPRWRGEHIPLTEISEKITGLSPLARGTPIICFCTTVPRRFIPAGAGNTYFLSSHESRYPVYPRWRGEHGKNISINNKRRRFIPAGAGNTRAAISR